MPNPDEFYSAWQGLLDEEPEHASREVLFPELIMNLQRSEGDLVEAPSTPPTFEDLCRTRSKGGLIGDGRKQSLHKARFEIYVALRAAQQGSKPAKLYNEICENFRHDKVTAGGATTKLNKLVDKIRNQDWHNTISLPGKSHKRAPPCILPRPNCLVLTRD